MSLQMYYSNYLWDIYQKNINKVRRHFNWPIATNYEKIGHPLNRIDSL
jgi:hypothetical protein